MPNPEKASAARGQFTILLVCHQCGQEGSSVWEENTGLSTQGPQSSLVNVSSGFYERLAKKAPHDIELVCDRCGSVQLG